MKSRKSKKVICEKPHGCALFREYPKKAQIFLKKGVDNPERLWYYSQALERDGKNKARKGREKPAQTKRTGP
ncbi:MAG: hypothetical protein E7554_02785 [Ruminococcaceae bacterium]|nr:hypothetical protein [Oscillospiraceae bacterium]